MSANNSGTPASGDSRIRVERRSAYVILTLDRPEKLNAIAREMAAELERQVRMADGDPDVKAIIITGAGRAFSVGADLQQAVDSDVEGFIRISDQSHSLCHCIASARVPVIAAVNGYALGGGLEIALSCDLIFADAEASFALPEISLAMVPGWGGTQRLVARAGFSLAMEMILTGKRIDALEAERRGIVNGVSGGGKVLETAIETAELFAAKAPLALSAAKECVRAAAQGAGHNGFGLERAHARALFLTADGQEGHKAFVEKRTPRFVGR